MSLLQWVPLIAFASSVALLYWLSRSGVASRLALDHPNDRSLHSLPTPRVGGLGVVLGFVVSAVLLPGVPQLLTGSVLALAFLSYCDDRIGLPVAMRFAAHLAAAGLFAASLAPQLGIWQAAVLVPIIAWAINVYNFMDGSDGLAGGMAAIGFSSMALAAASAGHPEIAWLCAAVAATALGFLVFNFPPAKLFMGDVGSVPLGYLVAAVGATGWSQGVWPFWFPMLVFSPFLVDASVTLARRALRRDRVWQAHHEHYYQRLVRMGWSHRRTALTEYALMLALGGSGLAIVRMGVVEQSIGVGAWVVVLTALMVLIDVRWRALSRNGRAVET